MKSKGNHPAPTFPHVVVFVNTMLLFFFLFFLSAFNVGLFFAFFVEFAAALGIDTEMIKTDNKKIIFIRIAA